MINVFCQQNEINKNINERIRQFFSYYTHIAVYNDYNSTRKYNMESTV